jgi:predicted O-methyltransferase YrrM
VGQGALTCRGMRVIDHHVPWLEEQTFQCEAPEGPLRILELGTYIASSTGAFLRAVKRRGSGHVTCVDHADYSRYVSAKAVEAGLGDGEWTFVQGDCEKQETIDRVRGTYDLIFVDAEHTREAVEFEVENYVKTMLRPGGLALFHDVLWPKFTVKDWWDGVDQDEWAYKEANVSGPSSMGMLRKK